jgi:hypothetical protein
MSAKAVLIAVGGLIGFLLTSALPLLRKEVLPAIDPKSLVHVTVKYNGDEGRNLWRNRHDHRVFAEGNAGFVFRVSNNSDFQVTLEDLRVRASEIYYLNASKGLWEGGWYYLSGADVIYDSVTIDLCDGGALNRSAFARVEIGKNDNDLSKFRKVVHVIPPHESEYVLITVACNANVMDTRLDLENRRGVLLRFEPVLVMNGREFTLTLQSPVHVLEWLPDDTKKVGPDENRPDLPPSAVYSHHDDEHYP